MVYSGGFLLRTPSSYTVQGIVGGTASLSLYYPGKSLSRIIYLYSFYQPIFKPYHSNVLFIYKIINTTTTTTLFFFIHIIIIIAIIVVAIVRKRRARVFNSNPIIVQLRRIQYPAKFRYRTLALSPVQSSTFFLLYRYQSLLSYGASNVLNYIIPSLYEFAVG